MEITSAVKRVFVPVTIVLSTEVEVANLLGALIAYGTGNVYAENGLKAVGLGDFYSGNVRKAARQIATEIVSKTDLGVNGLAELVAAYTASNKFSASHPSKAGAKVIGTDADLAPGREATSFESEGPAETESNEEAYDSASDYDEDHL